MKGKVEFICSTCNQPSVHYCRGMCNPCYQRHLRQRNKSRVAKIQTAKAQTPVQRMKRDDYPYTPPKVGPQFQVDLSQIIRVSGEERQVELVHKSDSIAPEEMTEYLHFCKIVFADSLAEGDITKGSSCLEEQALKLLRECNYNILRAKLAILFPIEYKLEPYSFDRITEDEVRRRVQQATADLEEVKEEKREDYSKKLSDALKDKVAKEELEMMVQVARSIKVEIPTDVHTQILAADEFSAEAAALLEQKNLKPDEVQRLAERSMQYAVITPTIAHLQQLAKDCREWEIKAAAALKGRPSTKLLQTLASEGSSLQVDLPQLEVIRSRYKHTKKWAENMHALTKPAKFKKDWIKPNLSQITALLDEAEEMRFTHCEIPGLESQVETVNSWRERLFMWTNDLLHDSINIEEMNELMEEYAKLPLALDTVKELSNIKEMCQWMMKAGAALKKEEKVAAKIFKALLLEAKQMNIQSGLVAAIEKEIEAANTWKTEAKTVLKNSEPLTVAEIAAFYLQGQSCKIDLEPLLKQVAAKAAKAQQWQTECAQLLSTQSWDWAQAEKLESEMKEANISAPEAEHILQGMKSAKEWKQRAAEFLSSFPKEVPAETDQSLLNALIEDCPTCLQTSEELSQLAAMSASAQQWSQDCKSYLSTTTEGSVDFSNSLCKRAKSHPVDSTLYHDLVNHSSLVLWTVSTEQALEGNISEKEARELLARANVDSLTGNTVYQRLVDALTQAEALRNDLAAAYEQGLTIDKLLQFNAIAKRIPLQFDAQTNIHQSLISHYSFQHRAQSALQETRSYSLYQSLISEGNALCCKLPEVDMLQSAVAPCEDWKQRAAQVLSLLHYEPEDECLPCCKRALVLEEYALMDKSESVVEDLISCVENAGEEEVVYSLHVSTTVDPVQGVVWVVRTQGSRQFQQGESKRRRVISQRIKELESGLMEATGKGKKEWRKIVGCSHTAETSEFLACTKCKEEGIDPQPSIPHTLSLTSLHSLILEARSLPLLLPELSALERLQSKGETWVSRAKEVVELFDSHSLGEITEEEVAKLLQEYESLPFDFQEKEKLHTIQQCLAWLHDAQSTLHDKANMRTLKRLLKTASEQSLTHFPEVAPLCKELQAKRQAIDHWSEALQRLQAEKAPLSEVKVLLEQQEVRQLQYDKFENLRKEVAQTEALAARVVDALQDKKSDLQALERLQVEVVRVKLAHDAFQSLSLAITSMRGWIEQVRVACQDGSPSTEALKQLLAEYQDIPCSHPLAQTLEEHVHVFCVCRQPDSGDRPMINCDGCKDWFHYDCVNIPSASAVEDLEYLCPRCCTDRGLPYRFEK